jgi:protein-tyrosine phosphatase
MIGESELTTVPPHLSIGDPFGDALSQRGMFTANIDDPKDLMNRALSDKNRQVSRYQHCPIHGVNVMRVPGHHIVSRRLSMVACSILVVGTIIAIAYAVSRYQTLYHFDTVDPGKLYRSGTLSKRGLEKAHTLTGFKTIINFRTEEEAKEGFWYAEERAFASEQGVHLVSLPMLPEVPPNTDQIRQFLSVVTNPERLPVLIHCEMGVIRTGMMVAVYRLSVLKEPNNTVLAELPMFGHNLAAHPAMKEFILKYAPGAESSTATLPPT